MANRAGPIGSQESQAAATVPGWAEHELLQFQRDFLSAGVIQGHGDELAVTENSGGANMTVEVGIGRALVSITPTLLEDNTPYLCPFVVTEVVELNITTADATFARKDRIIMRVDVATNPIGTASNISILEVLAGTPSGSPSAPALPSNAISLAIVDVPANDLAITDSQITDDRSYAELNSGVLASIARSSDLLTTQNDAPTWLGTITGTNTLTGTATPTRTSYTAGMRFAFIAQFSNTGAVTLNIDGIGAVALVGPDGEALSAGDILIGGIVEVRYDGTQFVMTSPKQSTSGGIGGNDNGLPQAELIVSRWYLDEASGTREDAVSSNDLTDNNTVTSSAGIDQLNATSPLSAQFTRSSSEYLSAADNAELSITDDMSISLWLYPDTTPAGSAVHAIVSKWDATTNLSFSFNYENGVFKLRISPDGTVPSIVDKTITATITEDDWSHVVLVYDASAGEIKLYVNGVQVGSTATGAPTSIFDGTAPIRIGADTAGSNTWNGRMQDVILWNAELTDAEVFYLYRLYTQPKEGLPTT
ncbi:LamG domain-containing protein [Blastopirellula marina]|uniref:LamG-like jellyroll fold domain-containing protein n=1 Tax=Blastopirellula marina TaxID=124 RepID=A0A2S8GSG4_9BACT|nr:LamG domain-containing protein [Blastopirellula marina]PQO47366.1 hypothetical protein C5Y93_04810 [Blastopirellula marina]